MCHIELGYDKALCDYSSSNGGNDSKHECSLQSVKGGNRGIRVDDEEELPIRRAKKAVRGPKKGRAVRQKRSSRDDDDDFIDNNEEEWVEDDLEDFPEDEGTEESGGGGSESDFNDGRKKVAAVKKAPSNKKKQEKGSRKKGKIKGKRNENAIMDTADSGDEDMKARLVDLT